MTDNEQIKTAETCDINELAKTMTQGIRRWEKVIYPMMIAFIILAAYGFYLIYNVSKDMRNISTDMYAMTKAVVTMTNTLNQKMNQIDRQMGAINIHMDKMNRNMEAVTRMDEHLIEMTTAINSMNASVNSMSHSIYSMVYSTNAMSSNLGELNDNISTPMKPMNSMMPWSMLPGGKTNRNNQPPPMPPRNRYQNNRYTQPQVTQSLKAQPQVVPNSNK